MSLPSFEISLVVSEASRGYFQAAVSDLGDLVSLLPRASRAQTGLETCRCRGMVLRCPCSEAQAGGAGSARSPVVMDREPVDPLQAGRGIASPAFTGYHTTVV